MAHERLWFGQVPVDVVTQAGALDAIERLVQARQGGSVFTPNIDHVVTAEDHAAFAAAYAGVSLSLADGMPLVWASHLLGRPLPERVAGSDLVGPLLELAGRRGWRVYFLGAGPGVAAKAAQVARTRWQTEVVGTAAPVVDPDDPAQLEDLTALLGAARADLVFLALGAPKQELLISRLAGRLAPAVLLGVGASLDFLAGTQPRAPRLMQRAGLEWLFRLSREPRRLWRRYLVNDPRFVGILLRTLARSRG